MECDESRHSFLGREKKNHNSHQSLSLRIMVPCVLDLTLLKRETLERQGGARIMACVLSTIMYSLF